LGNKEKARKRKERLRLEKHKKHFQSHIEPPAPPADVISVSVPPNQLLQEGILIEATCTVPRARGAFLKKNGLPIPEVKGYLMLDTGASRTCIDEEVALELGLISTGMQPTGGVHGMQDRPVYFVQVQLRQAGLNLEAPLVAVKELNRAMAPGKRRLIGLLGREFLRFAVLTYDGTVGKVDVVVRREVIHPKPVQPIVKAPPMYDNVATPAVSVGGKDSAASASAQSQP
jgi:hypothetical protein